MVRELFVNLAPVRFIVSHPGRYMVVFLEANNY